MYTVLSRKPVFLDVGLTLPIYDGLYGRAGDKEPSDGEEHEQAMHEWR